MRFEFRLQNAASRLAAIPKIREETRMALLCYGMRRAGHEAVIVNCSQEFSGSNRWPFFRHLIGELPDAVQVMGAATLTEHRPRDKTVAVKTSASWPHDHAILNHCDVAVFHEYDPAVTDHPKLLPVPFMVHTDVMDELVRVGLFQAYMDDDLEAIRAHYRQDKDIIAGFVGCGSYGRKSKAAQLPNWCQFQFGENMIYSPGDYLRWISRCQIGFNMEGETPKSYRFSELTLMGVVNAAPPCQSRVTPELTTTNSILMRDWSDADSLTDGLNRVDEIRKAADACYRDGWSPTGQSKLIAERIRG